VGDEVQGFLNRGQLLGSQYLLGERCDIQGLLQGLLPILHLIGVDTEEAPDPQT